MANSKGEVHGVECSDTAGGHTITRPLTAGSCRPDAQRCDTTKCCNVVKFSAK